MSVAPLDAIVSCLFLSLKSSLPVNISAAIRENHGVLSYFMRHTLRPEVSYWFVRQIIPHAPHLTRTTKPRHYMLPASGLAYSLARPYNYKHEHMFAGRIGTCAAMLRGPRDAMGQPVFKYPLDVVHLRLVSNTR